MSKVGLTLGVWIRRTGEVKQQCCVIFYQVVGEVEEKNPKQDRLYEANKERETVRRQTLLRDRNSVLNEFHSI